MKDQYVIACIDRPADAPAVLAWARLMAQRLNHKSLMVLNVDDGRQGLPPWLPALGVPYVNLHGRWDTAIEGLPTAFNGILAVTACTPSAPRTSLAHPRTLLRHFRNCKIAYLCIDPDRLSLGSTDHEAPGSGQTPAQRRPNAGLTLTHRREGKEKLVWASYLARFCGASLTIAHPDYRDPGLRARLANNMRFVDKMYTPLRVEWRKATLPSTTRVDLHALHTLHPDLLVAMTTDARDRDLIDLLSTQPELRLLAHPSRTPILFLNPRDDLYILCD